MTAAQVEVVASDPARVSRAPSDVLRLGVAALALVGLPPTAGFLVVQIGVGSAGNAGEVSPALGAQFSVPEFSLTTRDIADLALFLLSDESRFMTGAELTLDGGRSL